MKQRFTLIELLVEGPIIAAPVHRGTKNAVSFSEIFPFRKRMRRHLLFHKNRITL